jgi:hypothetical protein
MYGLAKDGYNNYACRHTGCFGVSVNADHLELLIMGALDEAVVTTPIETPAEEPDNNALAHLAAEYAAGNITKVEWEAARRAVATVPPRPAVVSSPLDGWQRLVAIERIDVAPRTVRGGRFDPKRVSIVWRA